MRRTVQVRLRFDFGFRISDLGFFTTIDDTKLNSSVFAILSLVQTNFSVDFQSAIHIPNSAIVDPVAHPPPRSRDEIHETSGLGLGLNGGFHVGEMISSRMKNNHLDELLGADITIKRRKVASTT